MKPPAYDLRPCDLATVAALVQLHHGYGSTGNNATYAFAVYEDGHAVAAYVWQPPPPGAARAVCPEAPAGVLALSRMVAVPRTQRRLQHISKPLRRQMRTLIDRTRWPVLLTYSDEGQGHTGHVYKCSGWEKTVRSERPVWVDGEGRRVSAYSNGGYGKRQGLTKAAPTFIQRWEHWVCPRGRALAHMQKSWKRVPRPGKVWRSGSPAFTWVPRASAAASNTRSGPSAHAGTGCPPGRPRSAR